MGNGAALRRQCSRPSSTLQATSISSSSRVNGRKTEFRSPAERASSIFDRPYFQCPGDLPPHNGLPAIYDLCGSFTCQIPTRMTMEPMVKELLASAFEVAQHANADVRVAALFAGANRGRPRPGAQTLGAGVGRDSAISPGGMAPFSWSMPGFFAAAITPDLLPSIPLGTKSRAISKRRTSAGS